MKTSIISLLAYLGYISLTANGFSHQFTTLEQGSKDKIGAPHASETVVGGHEDCESRRRLQFAVTGDTRSVAPMGSIATVAETDEEWRRMVAPSSHGS
ncbi:uncharacterized protein BO97DRAFT_428006 [Aspergillus homomorphus CBS 101889]|uniref:Uncharacterized protein n=1 Tax=Aspergillus homomorphus (strain CBS 101889) TaxID=1450537 RepID=A0A395HMQ8_ASPHC|nr:hypothetical protein BO97DRAFT_428006 [Aspergillus homomorphus CBS 101889]RAL08906.1 hypothetical protein BO97DRAFT_428006 [Aspergillus homomorphus CBS 101889]